MFSTLSSTDNKIVVPESLAIQLANSSEVSAENFLKILLRTYELQKNHPQRQSEKMVVVKELNEPPFLSITKPPLTSDPTDNRLHRTSSLKSISSKIVKVTTTEEASTSDLTTTSSESTTMESSTLARTLNDRPHIIMDALQPSRLIGNQHLNLIQTFSEDDDDDDDLDDGDDGENYEGSGGRADAKNSSSQFRMT